MRSTGANRAAIVSSFLVSESVAGGGEWSGFARLVAGPRDCMRSASARLETRIVRCLMLVMSSAGFSLRESQCTPELTCSFAGSVPSRRIAVSHICSGGTPKISDGSTSIVSQDDSAISCIELTRAPHGTADDDARAARRRRLQQFERQPARDGQQHPGTDLTLLVVRPLRFRHHNPGAVRIDGTADEQPQFRDPRAPSDPSSRPRARARPSAG